MTNSIPTIDPRNAVRSHREFSRWYEEKHADWPEELQKAGKFVVNDLWVLANNPHHVIDAIKKQAELTPPGVGLWDQMIGNMVKFIQLYAEWKG